MHDLHPETEIVHQGVRVTVRGIDLPKRGGGTHRREIVEAADAVVVLPWIADGQAEGFEFVGPGVVLIRNERFAVQDTLWELPAGTVERGESPDDCAPRELIEETGYRADRVEKLAEFFPTPGFCTELLHAYRAAGLTYVGQDLDETEKITAQAVAWDEAMKMVRDNTIRDAKSIATLLYHQTFGIPHDPEKQS
ncbi:NUDIX hydrolase [Algisphaera agarilytica]|uniref:GDP-mannose pyrophosphatase n=1 Tax=Algisphaera agarilytica TaxID=1385975 RepID=A0A7X0LKL9_9BACT|nr:NUDIX hydrolase [Algisphaera agarilytica]MBB6430575.1 ADP-ribose pyrophosphatase [Algisphaera agarilytica]